MSYHADRGARPPETSCNRCLVPSVVPGGKSSSRKKKARRSRAGTASPTARRDDRLQLSSARSRTLPSSVTGGRSLATRH